MSRNTVRRLLALPERPRYCRRDTHSLLDPFKGTVRELLQQDHHLTAPAIHRRLAAAGYTGGVTILKQYLATVRSGFGAGTSRLPPTGESDCSACPQPPMLPLSQQASPAPLGCADADPGELGMNMMSVDFEIIMVNRANEHLFRKPVNELLGRKCYEAFERRTDICPHCPGVAALHTGHPHRVEATGIRDDNTKYVVRLTAYPILGPSGEPVGFVETEEDMTELKRSERLAQVFEDLHGCLEVTQDMRSAIRQALNLAFTLEGVDFGCAYLRDPRTGHYATVAQRGTSRDLAETVLRSIGEGRGRGRGAVAHHIAVVDGAGATRGVAAPEPLLGAIALVPIVYEKRTIARLLLGSSTYAEFPAATQAALEGLGRVLSSAIATFRASELQKEMRAGLETLLHELPLPMWRTDAEGLIISWNRAAEEVLGWQAADVVGDPASLFISSRSGEDEKSVVCRTKSGGLFTADVGVVDAGSLFEAEGSCLTVLRQRTLVAPPAGKGTLLPVRPHIKGRGKPGLRILAVEMDETQRADLRRELRALGHLVNTCSTSEKALTAYRSALAKGRPFEAVVAPLLGASEPGGLELANRLRALAPDVRVYLTSDAPVVGWESYGLAGCFIRPFRREQLVKMLGQAAAGGEPDEPSPGGGSFALTDDTAKS